MESATLSNHLFTIPKTLTNLTPSVKSPTFHVLKTRFSSSSTTTNCFASLFPTKSGETLFPSYAAKSLKILSPRTPSIPRPFACISNSVGDLDSTAGDGGNLGSGSGGGGSGGGGGGSDGGRPETRSVAGDPQETSDLSQDVIVLQVGGMTCGGCAAKVKRILESRPQVSSANVNLETETAFVWATSEVKEMENWQQQLGETLAKHLTSCGFKANLRGQGCAVEVEMHS